MWSSEEIESCNRNNFAKYTTRRNGRDFKAQEQSHYIDWWMVLHIWFYTLPCTWQYTWFSYYGFLNLRRWCYTVTTIRQLSFYTHLMFCHFKHGCPSIYIHSCYRPTDMPAIIFHYMSSTHFIYWHILRPQFCPTLSDVSMNLILNIFLWHMQVFL